VTQLKQELESVIRLYEVKHIPKGLFYEREIEILQVNFHFIVFIANQF